MEFLLWLLLAIVVAVLAEQALMRLLRRLWIKLAPNSGRARRVLERPAGFTAPAVQEEWTSERRRVHAEQAEVYREGLRTRALELAGKTFMLDGVFEIVYYNRFHSWAWPLPEKPILLEEVFPHTSLEELKAAENKAIGLLCSAYKYGDPLLSKRFTNYEETIAQMAKDFPGFGRQSYESTASRGCTEAR